MMKMKRFVLYIALLLLPMATWADGEITMAGCQYGDFYNEDIRYWATFSNNGSVTFISKADAKAYIVKRNEAGYNPYRVIYITELATQTVGEVVGYVIPAGTGVLLNAAVNGEPLGPTTKTISYITLGNVTSDAVFTGNILRPSPSAGSIPSANDGHVHYYYKLAYGSTLQNGYDLSTLGFYWGNAENGGVFNSKPGTAYVDWDATDWSGGAAPAPFAFRDLDEENVTTSIVAVRFEKEVKKFVRDGQLYIVRDGVVYDTMGRTINMTER